MISNFWQRNYEPLRGLILLMIKCILIVMAFMLFLTHDILKTILILLWSSLFFCKNHLFLR